MKRLKLQRDGAPLHLLPGDVLKLGSLGLTLTFGEPDGAFLTAEVDDRRDVLRVGSWVVIDAAGAAPDWRPALRVVEVEELPGHERAPRLIFYGDPGVAPAVVQVRDGETDEQARHRHDKECAAKVRAEGLGPFICDHCDRPRYVCARDPDTCAKRRKATP